MPIPLPSSLRTRVLVAISLLFALLFGAALILLAQVQRHEREQTLERTLDQAQAFATAYERVLGDQISLLNAVVALPDFGVRDAAQCRRLFASVVASHGSLLDLAAVDSEDRLLCAANDSAGGLDLGAHPLFRRALSTGRIALGDSLALGKETRRAVLLVRPLLDREGRAHTLLVALIDQDWLNRRFADTVPSGVVLRILDAEGVFIVRQPDPACCIGRSGLHLLGIREALAGNRPHIAESVWLDNVRRLQADIPLKAPLAGVVSVGVPVALIETTANRGLFYATFALLTLCLLLYLLVWAGTQRYILRPMRVLADTVHRVRGGELGSRVPALPGHGEFDMLGADFNAMADDLARRQLKMEDDLRRLTGSESQLKLAASVFEQANEAITITDEKANIVAVSRRFTTITGYRADEVIGKNPRLLQSGRQDAAFYRAMWHALTTDGHWGGEIWNRRKDGTTYPEWLSISAVRDDSGRTTNYVAVFTDLTERVAAEAAIRASEQWHRSMLDNAPEGVWIIGPDECTVEANAQLCELLGYSPEEMRGRKPTDFTDEANSGVFELQKARRWTQLKRVYEIDLRRRDGRNIPVQFSAIGLLDAAGSPMAVLAFVTDLTQRRRDEQTLRESEARHRLIVDTALDAVISMDCEGCVTEWNGEAERMFGYRREAVLGRPIAELIVPPRLREAHRQGLKRYLATGKGKVLGTRIETTAMRSDGSEFPVDLAIATVGDGSGLFFSAFVRDITERKRHEEEMRRHRQELELRVAERTQALQRANRELEAFSYSISHDLRAPLRAINGFSHLLEEDYAASLDATARGYLARVRAGSVKMGALIDDLLELSRVSRHEMKLEEVDLSALAAEIAAELTTGEPGRRVEWIIAPGLDARCDAGLMRSALANLLGNAWKYTSRREHARIEFGAEEKDGGRVYFVRDNGAGFDMKFAGKLFGAFQRLHSPAEFPGTGVGLAIVARIVRRHGGEIRAEAHPDEGATFRFTLRPPITTL
ncbi:MAG: PAS domain S-box protein [Betaproteobacteria bacterium]|nr:PAS domain S-box protein [Betaproteobacteria bacterium]